MSSPPLETRVVTLEQAMAQLALAQARTETSLEKLTQDSQAFHEEMRAFKDEMLSFKNEMRVFREDTQAFKDEMRVFREDTQTFKDEMRVFKDEMRVFREDTQAFKDEMRAFKDEMRVFKDEMRASSERADRRWGELANKMGTLVEDIVAPGIPTVFRSVFEQQGEVELDVRQRPRSRRDPSRRREFDAVAWGGDVLLVVETKSALVPEDIGRFLETLSEVRDYYPEAEGRRVVGALASFYVEPSLVVGVERQGLLILGLSTGLLEVLNGPGFTPRAF